VLFADGCPGPNAACRLLQSRRSASTTSEPPEPRSPHPRSPACETYTSTALSDLRSFEPGDPPLARPISRGFTGQGREPHRGSTLLPRRSLAVGALPRPNPPGHLMSPTRGDADLESLRRRRETPFSSQPGRRRLRDDHLLGPPLVPPREEERDTPHPRCLPSENFPRRGATRLTTRCTQPVDCWGLRLFFLRAWEPIDGLSTSRGLDRARLNGC
jgi:hypothetical protein